MATEFRLLGPVEVRAAGRLVDIGPARQQGVLAALLCDINRCVSVDQVVERVWGDRRLPERPRNAVHTYISLLKRSLASVAGAAIVRQTYGYMIALDDELLDLHRFRSLIKSARSGRDGAVALFEQAFALWRGEALAVLDTPWADSTRRALDTERLAAESDLTDLQLELGQHAALLAALAERSAARPLDERLAGQLILALFRSGRQAEALRHYHRIRQQLADELGTVPGHALQLLYQRLLTDDPALVAPRNGAQNGAGTGAGALSAQPDAGPSVPRQLPADVPGFVGRRDHMYRLDAYLDETQGLDPRTGAIAAVCGSAGVGKTALAVRWSHSVADRFPDGQLYANLRGFDSDGQAVAAGEVIRDFLDALGVPPARIPATLNARAALYRSLLAGKRMLVVLDNARHSDQVRPLLPGTPTAFVLVTSRDQLTSLVALDGARPSTLGLLTRDEARELLVRRLGGIPVAARPGAVGTIITACAGLPLALTIVAARAQQTGFPLATLAAELGSSGRRLDVFDGGDPASQVRAVFSWSYATLGPPAARLFRILGAHFGPDISTAAAASLAALSVREARRLLRELTSANLVVEHVPGRYTWHDLLHAYARELLDAHDGAYVQHAAVSRVLDHYLHTGHTAAQLLAPARDPIVLEPARPGATPEQLADYGQALAWFTAEHRVLLAAVERAAAGWDVHAWQLGWVLDDVLDRRGRWTEQARVARIAVAAAERLDDLPALARARRYLAYTHIQLGRHDDAQAELRQALELQEKSGDLAGQAHTCHNLSMLAHEQGREAECLELTWRTLGLYRAAGHRQGQATALNSLGWSYALLGDYPQALTYCGQALDLYRELGNRDGQAATWDSLGYTRHHLGHHNQALDCYRHALRLRRELGNRSWTAATLAHLGDTHAATGDVDAARAAWAEALDILAELDHPDARELREKLGSS
jgi:DNA-binding SARP family transcriptional activator/tetratricopeptide (TPR) repeat protein